MAEPTIQVNVTVAEIHWIVSALEDFGSKQNTAMVRDRYYMLSEKFMRELVLSKRGDK